MHTLIVIAIGLVLLAGCALAARVVGAGVGKAALWFLPIWLMGAGMNMWIGVNRVGYSVAQEFPIFLVVFAVPALAALLLRWRAGR